MARGADRSGRAESVAAAALDVLGTGAVTADAAAGDGRVRRAARQRRAGLGIEPAAPQPQRGGGRAGARVARVGRMAGEADALPGPGEQRRRRRRAQKVLRARPPRVVDGVAGAAADADQPDAVRRPSVHRLPLRGGDRLQKSPRRVAARAGAVVARARVLIGARHRRLLPGDDVAVARRRVVADRADIGPQHAPARRRLRDRARSVAGEAADPPQSVQIAGQLLPPAVEIARGAQLRQRVREPAVQRAGLAGCVAGEGAARVIGPRRAVVDEPREHAGHPAGGRRFGDRGMTAGAAAVERRLVVAGRAERERVPVAIGEPPVAGHVGQQARVPPGGDRRAAALRARCDVPATPAEVDAHAHRRVGQAPRPVGGGHAGLAPQCAAAIVAPGRLQHHLGARARRQRDDPPRNRAQRRHASGQLETVSRRRYGDHRSADLLPGDAAARQLRAGHRRGDRERRIESNRLARDVEMKAFSARRRLPAAGERRGDQRSRPGQRPRAHEPPPSSREP